MHEHEPSRCGWKRTKKHPFGRIQFTMLEYVWVCDLYVVAHIQTQLLVFGCSPYGVALVCVREGGKLGIVVLAIKPFIVNEPHAIHTRLKPFQSRESCKCTEDMSRDNVREWRCSCFESHWVRQCSITISMKMEYAKSVLIH